MTFDDRLLIRHYRQQAQAEKQLSQISADVDNSEGGEEAQRLFEQMIEVKNSDAAVSPSLNYFYDKYKHPAVQVVRALKKERSENGIEIIEGVNFLKNLFL